MLTRRLFGQTAALLAGSAALPALAADVPEILPIWPGDPPGGEAVTVQEQVVERAKDPAALRDRYVQHVRRPTLTVFRPARPNGTSLLMAPGGGYKWVVMDKEGYETAARFALAGITVYVMTYRLPADGWAAGPATPLQDVQRAMRLVRHLAPGRGLDPARVAIMGFSAGGHVAGCGTLMFDRPAYRPIDAVDAVSARPDLALLCYPVASMDPAIAHAGSRKELLGEAPTAAAQTAWSLEDQVRPDAPPVFLLHALDDASVPPANALRLMEALRAARIPVEAHLFEEGGHGFGLRFTTGKPVAAWPDLALGWMKRKAFI
ncbi:acetyl esterase/lipase [Caulobacter ginsengisoli]|uniref:Acetyl esterase/lipase n=1 Tax=Caulobacter ginsengisoli TaxID=400775 RepID=A0ABU0IVB0_9CAUL|nr:alpha/beta hydrolase [Caulobacter ginsengisoli]MDQ0465058.1 acetyl esterase/lipase [Caulobacter ginsengisoli]